MAYKKDDVRSAGPEAPRQTKKKSRRLTRFLLILLVVLLIVLIAAWRDGTGFDALRRRLSYGYSNNERAGYLYDGASSNRFAVLNDKLVVLSGMQLQVLSNTATVYSKGLHMNTPALVENGNRAVAWDIGGQELYVVNEQGQELALTADEGESFISATLNDSGWLAVTAEKPNYKGAATVYDSTLTPVFTFNSSERFITDAYVTEDCKSMAAVTLGQQNSVFATNIVFYNLTETEPCASYSISDGLALSIGSVGEHVAVVTDTKLAFLSVADGIEASYDYAGGYLREFDLSGHDYAVLLLSRHKSGSMGRLVTVDSSGKEIASLDVSDQVLDISASGRYLAVLYADRCVIYTQRLEEYAVQSSTDYAKAVRMRGDGSALLLASSEATLFLP